MNIIDTIILGIVQGIAEFLPISSSAHLIIFRDIFGVGAFLTGNMALTFDISLHLGTLLAILIYFFKDFFNMVTKGFTKGIKDKDGKLFWYLIIATIPGALMGFIFEEKIEEVIRGNYLLIALSLAFMGVIIYLVDEFSKTEKDIKEMSLKDAIIIGVFQVFALIPGFSRSGSTITGGRLRKLKREDSAKFSFYLSAPIIGGAVFLKLITGEVFTLIKNDAFTFVLGVLISFLSGILCIKFLLNYIKKHDYKIFMWYRLVIALVILIILLFK